MKKTLEISNTLSLPLDAATQTFAFIARKGAGKTYAAGKMAECLLDAGVQVVVLDAVGNWWGLRLSADGKEAAYDIPVIGGLRGDIPLESAGGHLIADIITETGRSLIIDISQFSKADRQRFATAFGERLWLSKKAERHPSPIHLIIEESQLIVPQSVAGDTAKMVGIYEEIIRLGRNYGIGVTMISQRPQSVNKEVLNQTECLFVLQVNGKQERIALRDWIAYHGAERSLVDELPSLPIGTAYVWSPQWLQILQKVKIGHKKTFDASATPKVGTTQIRRDLKPLDLADLETRMAATIERAKAEDPKELRKQIAALKKQVAATPGAKVDPQAIEKIVQKNVGVVTRELDQRFNSMERQYQKTVADLRGRLDKIAAIASMNGHALHTPAPAVHTLSDSAHIMREKSAKPSPAKPVREANPSELEAAAYKILNVIAMLDTRGITAGKETVARWLGIHPNGGRFNRNLAALRAGGYLDGFTLTNVGSDAAEEMDTGLEAALAVLPEESMRAVLREVVNAGVPLSKEQLAERLGIHPNGGRFNRNLAWLRTMGVITERGPIEPTPGLFV